MEYVLYSVILYILVILFSVSFTIVLWKCCLYERRIYIQDLENKKLIEENEKNEYQKLISRINKNHDCKFTTVLSFLDYDQIDIPESDPWIIKTIDIDEIKSIMKFFKNGDIKKLDIILLNNLPATIFKNDVNGEIFFRIIFNVLKKNGVIYCHRIHETFFKIWFYRNLINVDDRYPIFGRTRKMGTYNYANWYIKHNKILNSDLKNILKKYGFEIKHKYDCPFLDKKIIYLHKK
jgi:hypothetical protein